MKCDVCNNKIKFNETYIYKKPEYINFCIQCAKKHIKDYQIKGVNTKEWIISFYK